MNNLKTIVNDYIQMVRESAKKELRWFKIQPSLADAVTLAALAEGPEGKRLNHQRRIKKTTLEESRQRLLGVIKKLERCTSFEELFTVVESTSGDIDGIGELTIYDTALRIGAKLGLEPKRIYLHSGTRIGAKRLGIDTSEQSISIKQVPKELRRLKPREIEDVLCIYKNCFGTGKIKSGSAVSGCSNLDLNDVKICR